MAAPNLAPLKISASCVGLALVAYVFSAAIWPDPPARRAPPAGSDLRPEREAAYRYLRAAVKSDGSFVYETDASGAAAPARYNFVRHGGAAWALGAYAEQFHVADVAGQVRGVTDFLVRALSPVGPGGALAVLSDPDLEKNGRHRRAALGASALALLALLERDRIDPGAVPPPTLRGLGKFLASMQAPDGRFWSTFEPDARRRSDAYASEYFPGEAALALYRLAAHDEAGREVWASSARRGLDHLVRTQSDSEPIIDAWALQALREGGLGRRRADDLRFVRRIVDAQTFDQSLVADRTEAFGCYGAHGRVASTAARLEGMLAAFEILRREDDDRRTWAVEHSIQLAVSCLRRGQRAGGGFIGQHASAPGAEPRDALVRIDNVQHALMAMVRFEASGLRRRPAQNLTARTLSHLRWRRQTLGNLRQRATRFHFLDAALAKMNHVDFTGAAIEESHLRGMVFIESKLRQTEWLDVEAQAARFLTCDLRDARFRNADLAAADFSFSDLRGAAFEGSNLRDASFAGSDLRGATYDEFTRLPFSKDEAARRGLSLLSSTNP